MPRTIITHVGTSLILDGCAAFKSFSQRQELLRDLRNNQDVNHYLDDATTHLSEQLRERWDGQKSTRCRESPAEMASLSLLGVTSEDHVALFHSQTPDGAFCAELLAHVLKQDLAPGKDYPHSLNVSVVKVPGLSISDNPLSTERRSGVGAFVSEGLKNYVYKALDEYNALKSRQPETPDDERQLLFNITGGYKGMIPIARDLSLLLVAYARMTERAIQSEVCYLYEDSTDLIRYPALPVLLDWSSIPEDLLRKAGEKEGISADEIMPGHKVLFMQKEQYSPYRHRSALGEVVWVLCQHIDYRKISVSQRDRLGQRLEKLQQEWGKRHQKLSRLGIAHAIESSVAEKFKLEEQLGEAERELAALTGKIEQLEHILNM